MAETYATWNPSDKGTNIILSGGNLTVVNSTAGWNMVRSTIGKSSGKWYWEVTVNGTNSHNIGIANSSANLSSYVGSDVNGWGWSETSLKYNNGSGTAYGANYTTGNVIGVALDMDAGTLTYYKNNVSQGTAATGLTGTWYAAAGSINSSSTTTNFGATSFTYSPPAGFVGLSQSLTDDLISYYKLDSNSNDSVGSNNGTDTSVSYVAGKIGNSASFNGGTSYINVPDNSNLSFTNKIFSVNFWFKTSSTSQAMILGKGQSGLGYEWAFYISNVAVGKIYATCMNSSGGNLWGGYTNSTYNDNNWHMFTATWNNAQPILYIDGAAVSMTGSGTGGTNTDGTAPLNIGRSSDNNNYFNGQVDEVGIWNRVLFASEVAQLYNNNNGLAYSFMPTIIFIPRPQLF